jgi:hypothetical protein
MRGLSSASADAESAARPPMARGSKNRRAAISEFRLGVLLNSDEQATSPLGTPLWERSILYSSGGRSIRSIP